MIYLNDIKCITKSEGKPCKIVSNYYWAKTSKRTKLNRTTNRSKERNKKEKDLGKFTLKPIELPLCRRKQFRGRDALIIQILELKLEIQEFALEIRDMSLQSGRRRINTLKGN